MQQIAKLAQHKKASNLEHLFICNNSLAGEEGFEPPNARTKTWCLTTWRLPNKNSLGGIVVALYNVQISSPRARLHQLTLMIYNRRCHPTTTHKKRGVL